MRGNQDEGSFFGAMVVQNGSKKGKIGGSCRLCQPCAKGKGRYRKKESANVVPLKIRVLPPEKPKNAVPLP